MTVSARASFDRTARAGAGPRALLLGLVALVFVLGQLISKMATALIIIPIAVSAATERDVSAKPVLMAVCCGRRCVPHTGHHSREPCMCVRA